MLRRQPLPLPSNTRKTERGAGLLLVRWMVRAAPFALLCVLVLAGCSRPPAAGVAAEVNGRAITYAELDKQYQFAQLGTANDKPSDEQVVIQRLEVLRALIDNEIMLQRAEREGLLAADSDVEARFTEMKA